MANIWNVTQSDLVLSASEKHWPDQRPFMSSFTLPKFRRKTGSEWTSVGSIVLIEHTSILNRRFVIRAQVDPFDHWWVSIALARQYAEVMARPKSRELVFASYFNNSRKSDVENLDFPVGCSWD